MNNKKKLEISERIKNIENKKTKEKNLKHHNSGFGIGLKVSLDLISPIFVGILIGLGIDKIFLTKPIFFLIFLILGIVAGFFNLFRATKTLK